MMDPNEVRMPQGAQADTPAQPQVTTQTTVQTTTTHYSMFARNWPRVFLLFSVAVAVLTFVSIIFNLLSIVLKPNVVLLNIYCLIFSLLALSAELRQFRWFRKISYTWMKYVYFLTYYKPRGIFYILLGLLLMGNSVLLYIAGALAIFVGVVVVLTSFICDLPVYDDPQERIREQEEARKYYEAKDGGTTASVASMLRKKTGMGTSATTAAADGATGAGAGAESGAYNFNIEVNDASTGDTYRPPTLPIQESHKAGGSPGGSPGMAGVAMFAGTGTTGSGIGGAANDNYSSSGNSPVGFGRAASNSNNTVDPDTVVAGQRQGTSGRIGETQLRRDFAAAMESDDLK